MVPLKITLVSRILHSLGGGGKDLALLYQNLDRRILRPRFLSELDITEYAQTYGIPRSDWDRCDLQDVPVLTTLLHGADVILVLTGTSNNTDEFLPIWEAARNVGAKLRIQRIVFGLGSAKPEKADLFLCSSIEGILVGERCRGCHVLYPSLPAHVPGTEDLRIKHDIPKDAFVVGYACADHRTEFYKVAELLQGENIYFLNALASIPPYPSFPKMRFCGILSQPQMASLYDASDMILHTRTESFGYSVYQGIMAAKPVAALWTDSKNAFAEAMWPEGGYLSRTPEGLRDAVLYIRDHREEALRRAETAKARAENLLPSVMTDQFEYRVLYMLRAKGFLSDDLWNLRPSFYEYPSESRILEWESQRQTIIQELSSHSFI